MAKNDKKLHEEFQRDLDMLNLTRIAEIYEEVLDEAARDGWSALNTLTHLVASEAVARADRSLQRRIKRARLPKLKTLQEYDFNFPTRIPKQKILRLFDCDFVEQKPGADTPSATPRWIRMRRSESCELKPTS